MAAVPKPRTLVEVDDADPRVLHFLDEVSTVLEHFPEPVVITCIAGGMGHGKSRTASLLVLYTMLMAGSRAVPPREYVPPAKLFRSSNAPTTCTSGIWLWPQPLPRLDGEPGSVLLIDVEGCGNATKMETCARLYLAAFLLASSFVVMLPGPRLHADVVDCLDAALHAALARGVTASHMPKLTFLRRDQSDFTIRDDEVAAGGAQRDGDDSAEDEPRDRHVTEAELVEHMLTHSMTPVQSTQLRYLLRDIRAVNLPRAPDVVTRPSSKPAALLAALRDPANADFAAGVRACALVTMCGAPKRLLGTTAPATLGELVKLAQDIIKCINGDPTVGTASNMAWTALRARLHPVMEQLKRDCARDAAAFSHGVVTTFRDRHMGSGKPVSTASDIDAACARVWEHVRGLTANAEQQLRAAIIAMLAPSTLPRATSLPAAAAASVCGVPPELEADCAAFGSRVMTGMTQPGGPMEACRAQLIQVREAQSDEQMRKFQEELVAERLRLAELEKQSNEFRAAITAVHTIQDRLRLYLSGPCSTCGGGAAGNARIVHMNCPHATADSPAYIYWVDRGSKKIVCCKCMKPYVDRDPEVIFCGHSSCKGRKIGRVLARDEAPGDR